MVKILIETDGFLPAILIDLLLEIAVPVKQPNRDKVQIEVAGRLAMIAGKNSEAAGIVGNGFMEAKLRREISNRLFQLTGGTFFPVSILAGEILLVTPVHFGEVAQKNLVLRHIDQPPLARELEHPDRIVIGAIPKLGIEMPEKPAR